MVKGYKQLAKRETRINICFHNFDTYAKYSQEFRVPEERDFPGTWNNQCQPRSESWERIFRLLWEHGCRFDWLISLVSWRSDGRDICSPRFQNDLLRRQQDSWKVGRQKGQFGKKPLLNSMEWNSVGKKENRKPLSSKFVDRTLKLNRRRGMTDRSRSDLTSIVRPKVH